MAAVLTPQRYSNLEKLHLPPSQLNGMEHLIRMLDALVDDYKAEKIIAFGSCVVGAVTRHSDLDLCVIREHPAESVKPRWEGRMAISRRGPALPYDLLVLTPCQWQQQNERPFGVYHEIINHGLVLYER